MKVINSKVPILSNNNFLYNCCTFDGKNYYFIQTKTNQIHVIDSKYQYLSKVELNKLYNAIVYNSKENIFYLSSNTSHLITMVDPEFNELQGYNLSNFCDGPIESIGYLEKEDKLCVIMKNSIIAVNNEDQEVTIVTENTEANNAKVVTKNISIVQNEINAYTAICDVNGDIYIAYNREKEAYIGKIEQGILVEEYYIDDDCTINNIINCKGKLNLFVVKNYNYIYETNIIIKEKEESRFVDSDSECYYHNCRPCCSKCESNSCFPKCQCNLECSICEMIESIALEEVGISHILNAEGEKLQKAICESENICDLLNINESINKTITNITMLEQVLHAKLELATNYNPQKECNNYEKGDESCQCR